MTILGISVSTFRTGVCVLKDEALQVRRIQDYDGVWSDRKLRIMVKDYRQYIQKYNVHAIIVKVSPLKKHTPPLKKILKRVEALAAEYHILFDLITKTELKGFTHTRTTSELIDYTRYKYPELNNLFDKGVSNEHSYNKKLFEAVLSAHVFQEKQRVRALQLEHQ